MRRSIVAVALAAATAATMLPAAVASASPGDLDSGFGKAGTIPIGAYVADVERAPDGGLVIAGGGQDNAFVGKFTAAGKPDTSFSGDANVPLAAAGVPYDMASQIERHLTGWIVVVTQDTGDATTARLTRLRGNGSIDRSFGTQGEVRLAGKALTVVGLEIDSAGRILVLAKNGKATLLSRFRADGTLDARFADAGVRRLSNSADVSPVGLAVQPGDTVGVALVATSSSRSWLMRVGNGGKVSSTFGGDGTAEVMIPRHTKTSASDLFVTDGGRLVVTGSAQNAENRTAVFAARFTARGTRDLTFGGDGTTTVSDPIWSLTQMSSTVDSSGRVYLSAITFNSTFMARLTTAGELDPAWAGDGTASPALPGWVTAWAQQESRMVLVTYYPIGSPPTRIVRMAI